MFSLIITLVAIALVSALALATLYYGGPVFNEGQSRARVAHIQNVFQQLSGANELYKAETGVYAPSLADLVGGNYLKSVPTAAASTGGALSFAQAADSFTFSMVTPGVNAFAASMVSLDVCVTVNKNAFGIAGVLAAPHALDSVTIQCYGADIDHLVVIQGKAPADLLSLVAAASTSVPVPAVSTAAIPAAGDIGTGPDGWTPLPASQAPVTPPVTPGLALDTIIPVNDYFLKPTYVASTDSLVYSWPVADWSSIVYQQYNLSTHASETFGLYLGAGAATDPLTGTPYSSASYPLLQKWNTGTLSWDLLGQPGCDLIGVYGSQVFMNCNETITSFDKFTGAQAVTSYAGISTNQLTSSEGRNQSTNTLMAWSYGVTVVEFMDTLTQTVTTATIPVSSTPFLTQSNRLFAQDLDTKDIYQMVGATPVKVVSGDDLRNAGCQYYNGIVSAIFERSNGKVELVCHYSEWANGSSTSQAQVMSFPPAQ